MTVTTWIIITLISLTFSAFFSGMEIAFVTSDRVRVELDRRQGGIVASALTRFYSNPDFFISAILVGNNIVLVIYGMGAAFLLEPWIRSWCDNEAVVLIVQSVISTAVILLAGEFFPKSIFRINPNTSLKVSALPMSLFYWILYPISLFSTWLSRGLMRLLGMKAGTHASSALSLVDLNRYIERTIDENEEHSNEAQVENEVKIFHNAVDFSTIHLRDCMIPRNEIVAVNIDTTTREELSRLFTTSGRSKIIVYSDDIDNVLGYIHVSELFHPDAEWRNLLKPVVFAPESLLANKMMRRLLAEKRSIAIIVDEFGGTAGMVTLEDLVEEILGDILDEHDHSNIVTRTVADGVYEVSGRAEIEYLREQLDIDIPESDEYQTLAGYLLHSTGAIPSQGASLDINGLRFKIVKSTATRLELIQIDTNAE